MQIQHGTELKFQLADAKNIKKSSKEQRQKNKQFEMPLQGAWFLCNANSHLNMQECVFLQFEWEEEIDLQTLSGTETLKQK